MRILVFTIGSCRSYLGRFSVHDQNNPQAQQRAFAQSFGRATTGVSGLITLGYILGKNDLATGFYEQSPAMRARDEASGRQPGAIYVPVLNRWMKVSGFAPWGTLISIGASIAREQERAEEEPGSELRRYAGIFGQAVADQPLLIGSKELSEAITRPGTLTERAGRLAGSFVPTIVSQASELTDPYKREAEGFTEQIQRRIPGLRNQLPVKTDALGRETPSTPLDIIDPTASREAQDKTDPLLGELVRLDLGISSLKQRKDETSEAYQERVRTFGQLYSQYGQMLLRSLPYQQGSDATKYELLSRLNQRAKQLVNEGDEEEAESKLSPSALFESLKKVRTK
jgi:hypothetical protein